MVGPDFERRRKSLEVLVHTAVVISRWLIILALIIGGLTFWRYYD